MGRKISKAEFARLHNYSLPYVSKLLKRGVLIEDENGKLDLEDSELRINARRDLGKRQRNGTFGSEEIVQIQTTYAKAKLKNEIAKGEILRMEAEEKSKRLIPASEVENTLFTVGRVIRDTMMNIPDRVSTLLANINDAREIHKILSLEIRSSLEELSRGR